MVCAWIVPLPLKRDSAVGRVLAGPRGVVFMLVSFDRETKIRLKWTGTKA